MVLFNTPVRFESKQTYLLHATQNILVEALSTTPYIPSGLYVRLRHETVPQDQEYRPEHYRHGIRLHIARAKHENSCLFRPERHADYRRFSPAHAHRPNNMQNDTPALIELRGKQHELAQIGRDNYTASMREFLERTARQGYRIAAFIASHNTHYSSLSLNFGTRLFDQTHLHLETQSQDLMSQDMRAWFAGLSGQSREPFERSH